MSFYYTLFFRKWGNFNWRQVEHNDCWNYVDDYQKMSEELAEMAKTNQISKIDLADKVANVMDLDKKAMSYCKNCPPRLAKGSIRIPGTNMWI